MRFQPLDSEILSFIRKYSNRPAPDSAFNALALKIFDYQFAQNRPYRQWCLSEGRDPSNVKNWKEIPAVPAAAFKRLKLASFPAFRAKKVFKTSGTTASVRGQHFFETLVLYDAAITEPFRQHLLADGAKLTYFFLMPPPATAPDSSLSYMMGEVNRLFARGKGRFYVRHNQPDYARLTRDLSREKGKVFLLTTAFALKGFLDFLLENETRLKLKAGSRIMETGGFKGRVTALSKKELYRRCGKFLGVPLKRIVSEYGMTELSSQYYDGVAPAWMRTVIVDPLTGREAKTSRPGLIRHIDLANRGSVLAIETEDLGRIRKGKVELLGRVSGAELRGCSLAFEQFVKR